MVRWNHKSSTNTPLARAEPTADPSSQVTKILYPTTCTFCANPLQPDDNGVMLKTCFHPFCCNCLGSLIQNSPSQHVPCPFTETSQTGDGDSVTTHCCGHVSMVEAQHVLADEDFLAFLAKPGFVPTLAEKNVHKLETETTPAPAAKKAKLPDIGTAVSSVNLNENPSACAFCTEELAGGSGIVLEMCGCTLCKSCISDAVVNSGVACVRCPVVNDDNSLCHGHLMDREVKHSVSDGRYEEYLERSLKEAKAAMGNVYQCKTPNCTGWCEVDEGSAKRAFACQVCSQINCLHCKAIHDGMDCAKYMDIMKVAAAEAGAESGEAFNQLVETKLKSESSCSGWDQITDWVSDSTQDVSTEEAFQKLESTVLLPTTKTFTCNICLEETKPGLGTVLHECLHQFCKGCLQSTIFHCNDPLVPCPHRDPEDGTSCNGFLTPREIQALVSGNVADAHVAQSLRQAELVIPNSFHCANADCAGWCIIEKEDEKEKNFSCPVCWKTTCVACKACHAGVTCSYYKESLRSDNSQIQARNEKKGEEALQKHLKDRKLMKCPRCKYICQKISGCDHVVCGACKHRFNWKGKTCAKL